MKKGSMSLHNYFVIGIPEGEHSRQKLDLKEEGCLMEDQERKQIW